MFTILVTLALSFRLLSASPEPAWGDFPGAESEDLKEATCGFDYYIWTGGAYLPTSSVEEGDLTGSITFFLPVGADGDTSFCSAKFMRAMIDNCNNMPGVMMLWPEVVEYDPPSLNGPPEGYPDPNCEMQFHYIVPRAQVEKKRNQADAVATTCLVTSINCARLYQQKPIQSCVCNLSILSIPLPRRPLPVLQLTQDFTA